MIQLSKIAVIISGFTFVAGNMNWIKWGSENYYHIPLAFFLFFLLYDCGKSVEWVKMPIEYLLIQCLTVLSVGNVVKQITYIDGLQAYDFIWGWLVMGVYAAVIIYKIIDEHRKR